MGVYDAKYLVYCCGLDGLGAHRQFDLDPVSGEELEKIVNGKS